MDICALGHARLYFDLRVFEVCDILRHILTFDWYVRVGMKPLNECTVMGRLEAFGFVW